VRDKSAPTGVRVILLISITGAWEPGVPLSS
jgi:hypothetical protein